MEDLIEAKKKKEELENLICDAISNFNVETGLKVHSVQVIREEVESGCSGNCTYYDVKCNVYL